MSEVESTSLRAGLFQADLAQIHKLVKVGFDKPHSSLSSSYGYLVGHLKRRSETSLHRAELQMGLNFCSFYPIFLLTSSYQKWTGICQPQTASEQCRKFLLGSDKPRKNDLIIWTIVNNLWQNAFLMIEMHSAFHSDISRSKKDLFHPCAFDIKRWKRAHLTPQSGLSVLEVISELICFVSPAPGMNDVRDPQLYIA